MRRSGRWLTLPFAAVLLVVLAQAAWAHVGIEVDNARPGASATYVVSVPNESETATTDRIEVQIPDGVAVQDFRPGRGWTMRAEDGVLVIAGGNIDPGQRREFRFTATNPSEPGEVTFPAIQTYSDGTEVRWVGEEGSDKPAPTVIYEGQPVVAATTPPSQAPTEVASQPASPAPTTPPATTPPASDPPAPTELATDQAVGDSGLGTVPIVLLVLAAIGVGLVWIARRRRT